MMNDTAMDIHVAGFVWLYVFISLGYIPSSGIAGLYAKSVLNILRHH